MEMNVLIAVVSVLAWSNPNSIERISGQAFAESLIKSMQVRVQQNQDVTDLLLGGVEVSLWMAEQLAADFRRIFPNLNVSTVSANKYVIIFAEFSAVCLYFYASWRDAIAFNWKFDMCMELFFVSEDRMNLLNLVSKSFT